MTRQVLGELFGRRAALGQDDVKLFAKHALCKLADALLRHVPLPFPLGRSIAHTCPRAWRGERPQSSICCSLSSCARCLLRLLDSPPYLLGCQRHVEIGNAEVSERIERRAD